MELKLKFELTETFLINSNKNGVRINTFKLKAKRINWFV